MTIPNIGDTVTIVSPGQIYSTYAVAAKKLGATSGWTYAVDGYEFRGAHAKVINTMYHEHASDVLLLLVEIDGGQQFIIGHNGVELVPRPVAVPSLKELLL